MAQRGSRPTEPRRSCSSSRSIFTTRPSISYSSSWRFSTHCWEWGWMSSSFWKGAVGGVLREQGAELAQGAGGGVAGGGEQRLAAVRPLAVETLEGRLRHVHLAAHLEALGHVGGAQLHRYAADGTEVFADVLAARAVAAGGALDEAAALGDEGHSQAGE